VTGLILLGLLPVIARRLADLAPAGAGGEAAEVPFAYLVAAALHAGFGTIYVVLGAFQFSAGLRRRRRGWHRAAGRVVVLAGLVVALTAVWLNQIDPHPQGGAPLYVLRLLFALALAFSIGWALRAILRRDVATHRAWMIRGFAIAVAAGTQVFTLGFGKAFFGEGELGEWLFSLVGWAINLGVAELVIRRGRRR
jgi:uncharacterized membrane protein YozB (DUF420 family)